MQYTPSHRVSIFYEKSTLFANRTKTYRKNAHDILRITYPKNESIWKNFHAKERKLRL